MAPMAAFERLIESLVERSLIAPLRGRLQPAQIAKRLERALRDRALIGVDAQLAPNEYLVRIHPDDFGALAPARNLLEGELARYVAQSGSGEGYVFLTPPTVRLVADVAIARRGVAIEATIRDPAPQGPDGRAQRTGPSTRPPAPPRRAADFPASGLMLDFGEWRAPLPDRPARLGRALDCDVVVPSPRVSRHHAELTPTADGVRVRDLGSTNGTTVNGTTAAEGLVRPGERVAFGGVEATLRPVEVGEADVSHA